MDAYGRVRCAILGATGLVAQRFFQRLQFHPWLEPVAVVGSPETAGTPYDECRWSLDEERPPPTDITIGGLENIPSLIEQFQSLGVRIIFSALPDEPAERVERNLSAAGFLVVSHAQIHRLQPDVPLIVPEVNIQDLNLLQKQSGSSEGRLISCSNCMVLPIAITLSPLIEIAGIKSVRIATQQALSGGGRLLLAKGRAGHNISPEIPGEDESIITELEKILSSDFKIEASCERVVRDHGHYARIEVEFHDSVSAHQVVRAWREIHSRSQELNLPSAAKKPIVFVDGELDESHRWVGFEEIENPALDLKAGMAVAVGEVEIEGTSLRFSLMADNTIRGAAGYSVLLVEQLLADGLLHDNNTILAQEI